MTINDLLKQVHEVYEGSTDYPTAGEDDYDLRFALLVGGIRQWADEPVNWRELYTTLADQGVGVGSGTKVTTAGVTSYDAPTNFVRPSSYLKVGDAYYGFIRLDSITNTQRVDVTSAYFTVSGTPQAYKIVINPAPTEDNLTISYPYYRTPTIPTLGTQVPEVPRPLYLVYHILARLYEQDNRNDLVSFYESKQDEQRQLMVVENLKKPADHFNTIPDIGNRLYGSGFGI